MHFTDGKSISRITSLRSTCKHHHMAGFIVYSNVLSFSRLENQVSECLSVCVTLRTRPVRYVRPFVFVIMVMTIQIF